MAIQKKLLQVCLIFISISSISAADEEFRNISFTAVKTKVIDYQKKISEVCDRLGLTPTVFSGNMNSQASAMMLGTKYKEEYKRLLKIEAARSGDVLASSEIGGSKIDHVLSAANSSVKRLGEEQGLVSVPKDPSPITMPNTLSSHHASLSSASSTNAIPSLVAPQ